MWDEKFIRLRRESHPHRHDTNMKQTKTLGLALGSGGWRGLAHIGVIKELEKNNIKIDYIAGTSAGALVGGVYASLGNIDKVEQIFRENMNYRRLLYAFSDPRPKWGLFKGDKIKNILDVYLPNQKIENCQIPFCSITTDLITGKVVELKNGSLSKAIRASISIPFFLQPVKHGKMRLIDGATAVPIPVKTTKQMGADIVIAVNLQKNQFPIKNINSSAIKTALKTSQVILYHLAQHTQAPADLVLYPDIKEHNDYSNPFTNFAKRNDVFSNGEAVVKKNIHIIKQLLS